MIFYIILFLLALGISGVVIDYKKGHREYWKMLWNNFKSPFILTCLFFFGLYHVTVIYSTHNLLTEVGKGYLLSTWQFQFINWIFIIGTWLCGSYLLFKRFSYKKDIKTDKRKKPLKRKTKKKVALDPKYDRSKE